jgi:hypothetical protein
MINMAQFVNTVADNTVVINGAQFKVTDEVAMQVLRLVSGIETKSQTTVAPSTSKTTSESKAPYVATKDFTPKYTIKEQTATDGTTLFCISRANGWTKAEKSLMNTAIKNLKGIKEIEVSYEKDGVKRSFKAWGYNTEATAKKHLKELPEIFTVAQLNGEA